MADDGADPIPTPPLDDRIDVILAKAERRKGFIYRTMDLIPPILYSRVAWLSATVGASGVAGADQADPDFAHYLMAVVKHPTFWYMTIAVVGAALIAYFHWRGTTAPKSWK